MPPFPRVALELRLEQHLDRPLNKPLVFSPAMDLSTPKGHSWVRMLRLTNRDTRHEQGLLGHPLAAKSIEAALVDGLLLAQPHNYSDALLHGTRVASPRAVREAIELLDAYPDRACLHPRWPARLMSASEHCRRGSSVPSTPHRCATSARCGYGGCGRTFWRQRPTSQQLAQLFTAGEFWIRADSPNLSKEIRRSTVGDFA
jgi:AraC-binding-like domain